MGWPACLVSATIVIPFPPFFMTHPGDFRRVRQTLLTFRPRGAFLNRQTEGTTEHAQELLTRCTPVSNSKPRSYGQQSSQQAPPSTLQPWRVLRERSRPGKLWVRVRAYSFVTHFWEDDPLADFCFAIWPCPQPVFDDERVV
jgi:hypothetical protein